MNNELFGNSEQVNTEPGLDSVELPCQMEEVRSWLGDAELEHKFNLWIVADRKRVAKMATERERNSIIALLEAQKPHPDYEEYDKRRKHFCDACWRIDELIKIIKKEEN